MSTNEIYADDVRSEGKPSRRLLVTVLAALLAAVVLGAAAYLIYKQRAAASQRSETGAAPAPASPAAEAQPVAANSWKIKGALTEACTCSVPCSCNFGQGPSPHSYCYPFYSYHIRQGSYGDVALDDLHFGSADLRSGRFIFIDERADERQREALLRIAARVIEKALPGDVEKKAKEIAEHVRYTKVEQSYDDRQNSLTVAGIGQFAADYVMGLDKTSPVVVRNNTTWRVRETIKAKTSAFNVRIGRDVVNTKETNSNQGEFEYTSEMNFGGAAQWNCGACANHAAQGGEASCSK